MGELDDVFGSSEANAALAGAAEGAVAGTAVAPGYGTAIGGALGAVTGLLSAKESKAASKESARAPKAAKAQKARPTRSERGYNADKLIKDWWEKHKDPASKHHAKVKAKLAEQGVDASTITEQTYQEVLARRNPSIAPQAPAFAPAFDPNAFFPSASGQVTAPTPTVAGFDSSQLWIVGGIIAAVFLLKGFGAGGSHGSRGIVIESAPESEQDLENDDEEGEDAVRRL